MTRWFKKSAGFSYSLVYFFVRLLYWIPLLSLLDAWLAAYGKAPFAEEVVIQPRVDHAKSESVYHLLRKHDTFDLHDVYAKP
mmetsp:Transcript_4143/g.5879  ORF Transcript_4143/g.5879 Transcript_4143/m.5879 type:complete len:82 (+) Transcript_4143:930-1175(+)